MGALADIRRTLAAHTTGGCGMSHHFTWTHGLELPPCVAALREKRLDCAHTRSEEFMKGVEALARDPRVPIAVIKSVRQGMAVARDALWIVDLLAIELSQASESLKAGRPLDDNTRKTVQDTGVMRVDGSLNTERCEAVIRQRQDVAGQLMLSARSLVLAVIDLLEGGASMAEIATRTAQSQALLERKTKEVDGEFVS